MSVVKLCFEGPRLPPAIDETCRDERAAATEDDKEESDGSEEDGGAGAAETRDRTPFSPFLPATGYIEEGCRGNGAEATGIAKITNAATPFWMTIKYGA